MKIDKLSIDGNKNSLEIADSVFSMTGEKSDLIKADIKIKKLIRVKKN